MKFYCKKCRRAFDEVEFSQMLMCLESVSARDYEKSGLCPDCWMEDQDEGDPDGDNNGNKMRMMQNAK